MKTKYLLLAVLGLSAWGCAKEDTPSVGETAKEYLSLWMEKYHPGIAPTSAGLYILNEEPGTGELWNYENDYAYVEVTVRTLEGDISSTSDELLSRQLGTYVSSNYYGPRFMSIGQGNSYAGVDALLDGMRVGGKRKAVIPAWMLTTNRYNTQQEYINASSVSSSLIYDIKLCGQTDDINQTETDSLRRYVTRHFGNVAPVTYKSDEEINGSFYFISDVSKFTDDDKRKVDSKVTINYTGRILNGQIFDTTVEMDAKDGKIYSASKTYSPVSITYATEWKNITMGEGSSLIDGVKGGLSLMQFIGQKAIIVFTSSQGYSSSGSGEAIPAWSPLQFELEIVASSDL